MEIDNNNSATLELLKTSAKISVESLQASTGKRGQTALVQMSPKVENEFNCQNVMKEQFKREMKSIQLKNKALKENLEEMMQNPWPFSWIGGKDSFLKIIEENISSELASDVKGD